ncbi:MULTISPECIES: ABC transporter ATP-binding protein [unclassified Bosea (in: a-proteobacteria)]|uniref:ABC transporter ATP-binding protein n=1 Tax=unclassified Bosea (in: a-proteobacteria) TaxID=2653178 RepID=UPI000F7590C0|nr:MULTISPECIES: ABC transporter ATP-binding protein [unclassified Bosea (in: a-proteobacteria)]AZO80127.1 peptide ABC transporter ATP-binding protein [Bosea sp. Tri-49]RXT22914.1 peptide ABC transporter ATP-binding protein [Bosea sp. Tri-39]RXT38383.1 peptide ABC transporter ATP-binding protein [Bosea sp. Tri-54]
MTSTTKPLLEVEGLTLRIGASGRTVVNDVSFSVSPGEIVGIVGESGSGKTLAARAVMGFIPPAVRLISGSIRFDGEEVTTMAQKRLRAIRGAKVGMVFQEPMTSLNPSMLIGRQLEEGLALHRKLDANGRRELILDMLRRVGIRDPEGAFNAYPHQYSGGMRQRIMLASVMLLKPALLLADEPTTALDAVVQRDVMELMVDLTKENGTAVLLISHDLGMVARYCSRIVVMCQGDVVEHGNSEDILARPQHPYTRKLLAAMPHREPAREVPEAGTPLVAVNDLVVDYGGRQGFFRKEQPKRALHGISLSVKPGEVVSVVGGSGSGKTTLGHAIAGLIKPSEGAILFNGKPIAKSETAYWDYRLNCQMVFQDPYSSLDPRMTIGELVGEPLRLVKGMGAAEKKSRLAEVLSEVGLGDGFAERYPHELSGGQRQRVAIARAIIRRPSFVIADEPVSALDVTVRAQVLELFAELQRKHGFSCLFISHDLGVVEQVSDRVIVMHEGRIVEEGTRDQIFDAPQHDYTRKLLSAVPGLESTQDGGVRLFWRLAETA